MTFHDVELPDDFQYSSGYGPSFNTIIRESPSGHELRVLSASQARHRCNLVQVLQSNAEAAALRAFALARRGSYAAFRVKDHGDFTSAPDGVSTPTVLDQPLGVGNGSRVLWPIYKLYGSGTPMEYPRRVNLPVPGTVVIASDSVPVTNFTVNSAGYVTFDSPPSNGAVLTCGFEFRMPARFSKSFEEWVKMDIRFFDQWDVRQLEIVEVLDEVEYPDRRPATGVRYHTPADKDVTLAFNDGEMHVVQATAAINLYLPQPTDVVPEGHEHFVLIVLPTSTHNVQVRDDVGNAVGAAITPPASATRYSYGFYRSGGSTYWIRTS